MMPGKMMIPVSPRGYKMSKTPIRTMRSKVNDDGVYHANYGVFMIDPMRASRKSVPNTENFARKLRHSIGEGSQLSRRENTNMSSYMSMRHTS